MFIYNVTVQVDKDIVVPWMDWLREVHIPEVMSTGCFAEYKILELMESLRTSFTYAVQYSATSMEMLQEYLQKHADALQKKASEKWGDNYIPFVSLLRVVN